jgi:two-component system sensor histidine kinase BaeS
VRYQRRRPPWWPENEPFPPTRRSHYYGPPPFVRWIGCFILTLGAVAFLGGGFAGAIAGGGGRIHPFFFIPVAIVVALVAIAAFGGVRRMARPMTDLIEAARRIESGDYSVRVAEEGSQDVQSVARAFNAMSARLKTIDEQRRNFMADVTHELRTPLSVIRGQAEAIADGVYPADETHLAPILDATQTLNRLVDDLKTLVETDAGNLVLHKESTDLGGLVRDAAESFRPQAESRAVSLSSDVADNLPPQSVDPARMRQVIGNLLSNALRHTPSGGSVTATLKPSGITVSDTGEGIPPEELPHVFERFAKGPHSDGSGLGLAIAREIVQAHGGRVAIDSAPGRGTTVSVELRAADTRGV